MNKEIALEKNAILFVDDEKICHTLVNLVIPNFTKYKVINAHNAEEAISLGKKYANSICLVLSDIMLPDISGYGIYKIFRKDKKLANIPFVFQSGIPCQGKEKQHPDYERAREAELAAIRKGNWNFEGIGKPQDL